MEVFMIYKKMNHSNASGDSKDEECHIFIERSNKNIVPVNYVG